MTTFVSNRDSGGKTNEDGHFRILSEILDGEIIRGFWPGAVSNNSFNVYIGEGAAIIPHNGYHYGVWSDSGVTTQVPAASSANPRIDSIVAYVDRSMSFSASQTNNPGALKFKVVAGTPAAAPTAPSASAIQNSIGAGNPYIILGQVNVARGASTITAANVKSNGRKGVSISPNVSVGNMVTSRKSQKIEFDIITEGQSLPPAVPGKTLVVFVTKNG